MKKRSTWMQQRKEGLKLEGESHLTKTCSAWKKGHFSIRYAMRRGGSLTILRQRETSKILASSSINSTVSANRIAVVALRMPSQPVYESRRLPHLFDCWQTFLRCLGQRLATSCIP